MRRPQGRWQADAARPRTVLRAHWGIGNKLHDVGDVTFDENRSAVRKDSAPQVGAACRNLMIALLRRVGAANFAAACRTCADRSKTTIALVATAGCKVTK